MNVSLGLEIIKKYGWNQKLKIARGACRGDLTPSEISPSSSRRRRRVAARQPVLLRRRPTLRNPLKRSESTKTGCSALARSATSAARWNNVLSRGMSPRIPPPLSRSLPRRLPSPPVSRTKPTPSLRIARRQLHRLLLRWSNVRGCGCNRRRHSALQPSAHNAMTGASCCWTRWPPKRRLHLAPPVRLLPPIWTRKRSPVRLSARYRRQPTLGRCRRRCRRHALCNQHTPRLPLPLRLPRRRLAGATTGDPSTGESATSGKIA